ncbi:MAG: hypothetical protein MHMPM18_000191 [Marteilia pararefringens]
MWHNAMRTECGVLLSGEAKKVKSKPRTALQVNRKIKSVGCQSKRLYYIWLSNIVHKLSGESCG